MAARRIIAMGLALIALVAAEAAWAQRVPWRYGRRSDPLLEPRYKVFDIEWRRRLVERDLLEYAPRELAGPAADALTGEIVVATRDGFVRLFTSTGRLIWENAIPGAPTGTPLMTDMAIYLGATDGRIHCIARFDGAVTWSAPIGAAVLETPAAANGRIFVGTDQDAVHAFDEATGEPIWTYRRDTGRGLSIRGGTGVSVADGRVYAGFSDGAVVALAEADGRILWEARLASSTVDKFPDADAVPIYRDGTLFVTVFNEGTFALDAATGRLRWRADTRGASSLALDGDLLLVGGAGAWGIDANTGTIAWAIDLGRGATAQPVPADGMAVFSGTMGMLFVDRATGRPLRVFDPGSQFASRPARRSHHLYALSNLGHLYALRIATE